MNQARRKAIRTIQDNLGKIKGDIEALLSVEVDQRRQALTNFIGGGTLSTLAEEVDGIKDEEQEYFDNMPEGLQGSERGETAEAAVNNLEVASDSLTTASEDFDGMTAEDFDLDEFEDKITEVTDAIDEADSALGDAL